MLQDRTQRFGTREVRCEAGAVPATVTGKHPSENHSRLSLGQSAGKAGGGVDEPSRETKLERGHRNPGARKPTRRRTMESRGSTRQVAPWSRPALAHSALALPA